jgi:hypothetical protein
MRFINWLKLTKSRGRVRHYGSEWERVMREARRTENSRVLASAQAQTIIKIVGGVKG